MVVVISKEKEVHIEVDITGTIELDIDTDHIDIIGKSHQTTTQSQPNTPLNVSL